MTTLLWLFLLGVVLISLILILIPNKRYKWIYILYKTFPRDFRGAIYFLKINFQLSSWIKENATVSRIFLKSLEKYPEKIIFAFEDVTWTYQKLEDYSNQVANLFKFLEYERGDCVALLLENRPEFVGIWLGLSKLGIKSALINTNLVKDPLIHCLKIAKCKSFIYGSNFKDAVQEIMDSIKSITLYEFGEENVSTKSFNQELSKFSTKTVENPPELSIKDELLYIYTSGTTGLPKAAKITHQKFLLTTTSMYHFTALNDKDIFYNPLPLYHTAGGVVPIGCGLFYGVKVVLRRKFSATNFWIDCKKFNCTVINYIGEICRYLLMAHKIEIKDHGVKKMIGNGLRPQIWRNFQDQFGVDQIFEFYGSTEGNCNLLNIDNTVGSVGFVPRYAQFLHPVNLIRCDMTTGEPIRNEKNFCIRCDINEPGLLIGQVDKKRVLTEFHGYADSAAATEKKLLRNVFKNDDLFFNSGDVLMQNEFGYFYFVDRTGDTFRWKGENVATSEVESIISKMANLKDVVVYGVQIPHTEGRAGMAAIVDPERECNIANLAKSLKIQLPGYAIPIFLRIIQNLPLTGTFKMKKTEIVEENFNCELIKDPLYYYDSKNSQYLPLTLEIYAQIVEGKIRF